VPRLQQKKRVCGVVTGTTPKDGTAADLPSNVLVVDRSVPIQYLLSQCSLAAHCGCTLWTGATLKAGTPSVPCPFVGEQRFWAVQLQELGVATSQVPIEKLTPDSLASAITATLADSSVRKRASEVQSMLSSDNGVHAAVDLISRFMQRPWDRHHMQILPRREGDLEMLEGGMFKAWNRYKFVLKDHCLEYHRYLPTGLHDPSVLGTLLIAEGDAMDFIDSAGHQQYCLEIKDSKGKRLAVCAATSSREKDAWINAVKEVALTWETARGAEQSWSTNMSNRMKDAEIDESGNISTKSSKNRTIEDTVQNSKSTSSKSKVKG